MKDPQDSCGSRKGTWCYLPIDYLIVLTIIAKFVNTHSSTLRLLPIKHFFKFLFKVHRQTYLYFFPWLGEKKFAFVNFKIKNNKI